MSDLSDTLRDLGERLGAEGYGWEAIITREGPEGEETIAHVTTANPDPGVIDESVAALLRVAEIVRRHTHQGLFAMTYHAGPDPEHDCLLCRALVDARVLTLDGIGAGTRDAIRAERHRPRRKGS